MSHPTRAFLASEKKCACDKKVRACETLFGRRRCVDITRNVAAVAPERSSLAYGPVVLEEHNSSRSITPRAIISSFQRDSPEVFLPLPPSSCSSSPSSFSTFSSSSPTPRHTGASSFRRRTHTPRVPADTRTCVRVPDANSYGMYKSVASNKQERNFTCFSIFFSRNLRELMAITRLRCRVRSFCAQIAKC